MLVELDVFSGRTNPQWSLDERSVQELWRLHSELTEATTRPPELPGLGYRGFCYSDLAGSYRACHGFVRTPHGLLADSSLSIERFLLDQLPPALAGFRERIASELGQRE